MKILMLIGAIIGFSLGLALGVSGHAGWPATLWRAAVAAAAMGLLMRWWGRVWLRSLQVALIERKTAEALARQQKQSATNSKK